MNVKLVSNIQTCRMLIMDMSDNVYIFTTLEFPTHNFDFHLLTTRVNAKYYY